MSKHLHTWRDLIDAFGGPTEFARSIGCQVGAAKMMRKRNSVHLDHWPMIVARAPAAGLQGITFDFLMTLRKGNAKRGRFSDESRVA